MMKPALAMSPADPVLDALCQRLANRADAIDASACWPADQIAWAAEAGVFRWSLPEAWDGLEWSDADLLEGHLKLASACLSTTFVLTQPAGALRRVVDCQNHELKRRVLPDMAAGRGFASVGISHLTTSRQHVAQPVMRARETDGGFVLDGAIPWVTGGDHARWIVTGATLDDGRQLLVLLPAEQPGVRAAPPASLIGLSATHTGEVHCQEVEIGPEWVLAGPVENVLSQGRTAATGGLQTSALALGLAHAAISFLETSAEARHELTPPADGLRATWTTLHEQLHALACHRSACTPQDLRSQANSLALRASQAALTAAKGAGYVAGHPAGRWCREALFFLVWSCPAPVMNAALCELAGIAVD